MVDCLPPDVAHLILDYLDLPQREFGVLDVLDLDAYCVVQELAAGSCRPHKWKTANGRLLTDIIGERCELDQHGNRPVLVSVVPKCVNVMCKMSNGRVQLISLFRGTADDTVLVKYHASHCLCHMETCWANVKTTTTSPWTQALYDR